MWVLDETDDVDKFLKIPYFTEKTGAPILRDCLAFLDCRVVRKMDSGDHTIFLGETLSGRVLAPGRGLEYDLKDYLNVSAHPDGPFP